MNTPPSRFDVTRPPGPRLEEYVAKFTDRYDAGHDVAGEARFVDALAARNSVIIDGACGTGRTAEALRKAGHRVIGIDRSARLIEVARSYFPDTSFIEHDLLDVTAGDLRGADFPELVDIVVLAGNVMPCLAAGTERAVLDNLRKLLAPGGLVVAGFRTDREYPISQLDEDAEALGFDEVHRFCDWQLGAWRSDSLFVVTVLAASS